MVVVDKDGFVTVLCIAVCTTKFRKCVCMCCTVTFTNRRSSLILTGSYFCSPEIGPSYHYYHKTPSSEAIVELPLAAFRGLRLFRRPEFFTSK
ncbi:hypothetical protein K443DRAFT_686281 [Laccaria amethystina LaAM-08-1]|uniref:Uncharacterized protein n=1 Tax=Laccaria amethystina LaAM-08-1 TaxID=1095629 RepID=A0A0C9WHF7_9AGAR|nr:hypothetical protein K443DRAFT_686281 [Laccaria amethystina LaAM-08-1]